MTSSTTNTPSSGTAATWRARARSGSRLADTYAVDIDAGEDDVLILAAAVVIDLVSHPDKKKD